MIFNKKINIFRTKIYKYIICQARLYFKIYLGKIKKTYPLRYFEVVCLHKSLKLEEMIIIQANFAYYQILIFRYKNSR